MLTDGDIKKLKTVFATKQELKNLTKTFATKKELKEEIGSLKIDLQLQINELQSDVKEIKDTTHQILTTVEGLTKPINKLETEYYAVSAQLDRHETWIKKSAPKIGVAFAE